MTSTGLAVFAYNRPDHLKQVLYGLRQNSVDHVYFFVDGPKNIEDKKKVNEVKDIIRNIDWCDNELIVRETNYGLSRSLIAGINYVFQEHDRIVVLEDDCVPSTNFLSFMKRCLDRYGDCIKVMNINGYSLPIKIPADYEHDVYFTYRSSSWGWGTWRSSWEHFEQDPLELSELKENEQIIKSQISKAGDDLYPMMRAQLKGEIDSWAVWWSYAIAINDGVCINPVSSKIRNIGHDDTGTHTSATDRFEVELQNESITDLTFPDRVFVDERINRRHNSYIQPGVLKKAKAQGLHYCAKFLKSAGLWEIYKSLSEGKHKK